MCEHNGLTLIDCEACTNAHAVCAHNILFSMSREACCNAGTDCTHFTGGDWQYNPPLGDQPLYCNVYTQQYAPPQATPHDLNFIGQTPSTSYDLGAVRPQTVDPSQITHAPPTASLVDSLYPPGVASYMRYRSRLTQLLDSPCIRDCTPEDSNHTKYFFTKTQADHGVIYRCSVQGCEDTFSRLDRATNHFRTHIEHRPFECTGCDKENCNDRFYSNETRKAHMVKKMATCECGSYLESKNLKRHQEQAKGCTATRTAE